MKSTPEYKLYRRAITARRNTDLEYAAKAAGWNNLSEYHTAVRAGSASIPPKPTTKAARAAKGKVTK